MITIRVWGGIGNQLFQYAFGEYLRLKTEQDVRYDILSFGSSDKLRNFELAVLNPNLLLSTNIRFSQHTKYKNRFYRLLFQLNSKNKFIPENSFVLKDACQFKNYKHYYLQGYWQNKAYSDEVLKTEANFFTPKEAIPVELQTIKKAIDEAKQSVALHVRRGDYFRPENVGVFGVCDVAYYQRTMDLLRQKYEDAKFFVFSDDLDWVKQNVNLSENTVLIPNLDVNPYWYIVLMSQCKHNIISNSSFSWWGAYLNTNKDKTVICPQKWTLTSEKTIALPTWQKI